MYKGLTGYQQGLCNTVIQHTEGIKLYTKENSSSPYKGLKLAAI